MSEEPTTDDKGYSEATDAAVANTWARMYNALRAKGVPRKVARDWMKVYIRIVIEKSFK